MITMLTFMKLQLIFLSQKGFINTKFLILQNPDLNVFITMHIGDTETI